MTREIKFRAWALTNTGGYMTAEFGLGGIPFITDSKGIVNLIPMQYTGLKDKNGKEIYEGDIVEFENDIGNGPFRDQGVVEYEPQYAAFQLISGDLTNRKSSAVLWAFHKNMKSQAVVIGDFYQNPELLK